jgi:hypothetical protein
MLSDEPDLTRELDEAEEIVMGRAESIVTEWGVRTGSRSILDGQVAFCGFDRAGESRARELAAGDPGALVRRTVTYGPWEVVPGEH